MHSKAFETRNCGLLVSVRNMAEAKIAAHANVSIIDLKEPNGGSLGCVPMNCAKEIAASIPPNISQSIALGEVSEWPPWPGENATSVQNVLGPFDFAKIGLSNLTGVSSWVEQWKKCLSQLPNRVQRVAVAYADYQLANSPAPQAIVEAAPEAGCSTLLIDTYTKGQGTFFDFAEDGKLKSAIRSARKLGMKIVIAGSLTEQNLPEAFHYGPDFIAVRGAVCTGDRTSTIDPKKVERLAKRIKEFNSGFEPGNKLMDCQT